MNELLNIAGGLAALAVVGSLVALLVMTYRRRAKAEYERALEALRKRTEEAQAAKDAEVEAKALKHKKKTDRGG